MIAWIAAQVRRADLPKLYPCFALLVALAWPLDSATTAPLVLEIASASASADRRTGEPIVTITFTESSGRLLADVSTPPVGKTAKIRVDGRIITESVIREPLVGGHIQLSGGFTATQAADIAERLSRGRRVFEILAAAD